MIEPILRQHAPYDFDEADAFLSANDDELRLEAVDMELARSTLASIEGEGHE